MTPVEILWTAFKERVANISDRLIPSKMSSSRMNQPWINSLIKILSLRKQRAYNQTGSSGNTKDWAKFRKLQKLQNQECKKAFHKYIMDIISPDLYERPKRFWSYTKGLKCDNNGVAPLRGPDVLV